MLPSQRNKPIRFPRSPAATLCSVYVRRAAAADRTRSSSTGHVHRRAEGVGKPYNADWRAWGDCHWWQNVRHMYHPMLAAGDFEMMDPLFRPVRGGAAAVRGQGEALPRRRRLLLPRDDDRLGHLFQRRLRLGPRRPPAQGRAVPLVAICLEPGAGAGRVDARPLGLHRRRGVSEGTGRCRWPNRC